MVLINRQMKHKWLAYVRYAFIRMQRQFRLWVQGWKFKLFGTVCIVFECIGDSFVYIGFLAFLALCWQSRGIFDSCNRYVNCTSKKMYFVLSLCIQQINGCEQPISGHRSSIVGAWRGRIGVWTITVELFLITIGH